MDKIKSAEEILKKHCPSMDDLFLDYSGRQFRERIIKAMNEYASQKCKALQEENARLTERIDKMVSGENYVKITTDLQKNIKVLEEALKDCVLTLEELDRDFDCLTSAGKAKVSNYKQALTEPFKRF